MPPIPRVSVVMPVRNAARYLDASIDSILGQTFTEFELVILDDGSTDGSWEAIVSWAARDGRIRLHRAPQPLGLVGSSNCVVRISSAPLVARMDADDVSHPERLGREVAALDASPSSVLVGTLFEGIDEDGRIVRPRDRWRLTRPSRFAPFPHGSVMFRRDAFETAGGYVHGTEYWEDLSLFHRLAAQGGVLVVPAALYRYRYHASGSRLVSPQDEVDRAILRMWRTVAGGRPPHEAAEAERDPLALYSLVASRLWAGERFELLTRLRPGSFRRPSLTALGVLAVALAGSVSPKLTRSVLARVIETRDRLAGYPVDGEPVEWHFAS